MAGRNIPLIGIAMGDACGIGPEIVVKALSKKEVYDICRPLVVGNSKVMQHTINAIGADLEIKEVNDISETKFQYGSIKILNIDNISLEDITHDIPNEISGKSQMEYLQRAVNLALESKIDAVLTAPMSKYAYRKAGFEFPGLAEVFGYLTSSEFVTSMFLTSKLRVVHVTSHLPLIEACRSIKKSVVSKTIGLANEGMKLLGYKNPGIAVAGLNPHAGEFGIFGKEEIEEIKPAIEETRKRGINVSGPYSPDTICLRAIKGEFDCVVAMYHDQGHTPIKVTEFGKGTNLFLGTPIIAATVDHGTAYEIVGKGVANCESLFESIKRIVNISGKIIKK